MKKIIAMMLTLVMTVGCLTGCGGAADDQGGEQTTTSQEQTTNDSAQIDESKSSEPEDIVEVFWQYPAQQDVNKGFYEMEEKLNEMMEKDIGVHVTFIPTGLNNAQQDAILAVSAGEQLDICLTAFTSVGNLVEKGLVLPLEDLLKETGTGDIFIDNHADPYQSCAYKGEVYGVPTGNAGYNILAYNMKISFAEKYDVMPDDTKVYTIAEMDAIFDKIAAGEGKGFICYVPWNNTYEPLNYNLGSYSTLGGDMSYGVVMLNESLDNTTVVNLFETEVYKEYCGYTYSWAQKGYISPDAAVAEVFDVEMTDPKVLGTFAYGAPELSMVENNSFGEPVVQFKMTEPIISGGTAGVMWNIPITSGNPGKALEALAYIYENREAAWLIQHGIEGENWNIVEQDGDAVRGKYVKEDLTELDYLNPYGLWGDVLAMPIMDDNTSLYAKVMRAEYDDLYRSEGRVSGLGGYIFDAAPVSSEVAAVQTVIAQYATSLNCGVLDPEKALPEFNSALKDAGLYDIIAENQKQLDAWLANK